MRKKLKVLSEILDEQVKDARRIAHDSRESAREINRVASASPSSSGDREHAVNQAVLNENKFKDLLNFQKKIIDSVDKPIPNSVEPVCFVLLRFEDRKELGVYLVQSSIHLKDFVMVTTNSPLGAAINGKKVGEKFKYYFHGNTRSGIVVGIE